MDHLESSVNDWWKCWEFDRLALVQCRRVWRNTFTSIDVFVSVSLVTGRFRSDSHRPFHRNLHLSCEWFRLDTKALSEDRYSLRYSVNRTKVHFSIVERFQASCPKEEKFDENSFSTPSKVMTTVSARQKQCSPRLAHDSLCLPSILPMELPRPRQNYSWNHWRKVHRTTCRRREWSLFIELRFSFVRLTADRWTVLLVVGRDSARKVWGWASLFWSRFYSMIVVVEQVELFHRCVQHRDLQFQPIHHHHFAIEEFCSLDSKRKKTRWSKQSLQIENKHLRRGTDKHRERQSLNIPVKKCCERT